MFYLTISSQNNNEKRHIWAKGLTVEELEKVAASYPNTNNNVNLEIYNGRWELIKSVHANIKMV